MLAHGDELGRTQQGTTSIYAQDNELAWVDWDLDAPRLRLLAFTQRLVHLRREHPVLRRRRFFAGEPHRERDSNLRDICWLTPFGKPMQTEDWQDFRARAVMIFINGDAITESDRRGEPIVDDSFLIIFNASDRELAVTVPPVDFGSQWTCVLDTDNNLQNGATIQAGTSAAVSASSTLVLTRAPANTNSHTVEFPFSGPGNDSRSAA